MANPSENRKKEHEDDGFQENEQDALAQTHYRSREQGQPPRAAAPRCPKCGATLEDITFQEVQIERCAGCRGIWLDAGELELVTARETEGWLSHFWRSSKGH